MLKLYDRKIPPKIILKTTGNACNINCKYCFELKKNVSNSIISPETLEKLIHKISIHFPIIFHGGENFLINKNKFRELLSIVKRNYPHKITSVKIQSNGTLLDSEWCEILFNEYKDLGIDIALSLDGTKEMNSLRVDQNNLNTFDKVLNAYKLLEKYGKKSGMLSVISKNSLDFHNEYVDFISSIPNLTFVKINALFNVDKNNLSEDSVTPTEFANFIIKVAEHYINNKLYNRLPIEPILSILQKLKGKESRYCNYQKNKCYNYISVYPDGQIAPCDCFSADEFTIAYLDKLDDDLEIAIDQAIKKGNSLTLQNIVKNCEMCKIKNFCTGGCLSQRYYFSGNKELSDDFCASKHRLYNYFSNLVIK